MGNSLHHCQRLGGRPLSMTDLPRWSPSIGATYSPSLGGFPSFLVEAGPSLIAGVRCADNRPMFLRLHVEKRPPGPCFRRSDCPATPANPSFRCLRGAMARPRVHGFWYQLNIYPTSGNLGGAGNLCWRAAVCERPVESHGGPAGEREHFKRGKAATSPARRTGRASKVFAPPELIPHGRNSGHPWQRTIPLNYSNSRRA